ncbi:MAG: transposase [Pseudomonadota bacterium]
MAGCSWRPLPGGFPPRRTVYRQFAAWRRTSRFEKINHELVMSDTEKAEAAHSPC